MNYSESKNTTPQITSTFSYKLLGILLVFVASFGNNALSQLHAPVNCANPATAGTINWTSTPATTSDFNWLPNGALTNTLNNISGTGVNTTVTFSGETNTLGPWGIGAQPPNLGTIATGGSPQALEFFTNGFTTGIYITFTFSEPLTEVAFDLYHVNGLGANGDLYTITGTDGLGGTV